MTVAESSDSLPLAASRRWVETFVVAHDVCPFAGRELARDTIRYVEVDAADLERALLEVINECRLLDSHPGIETTLLVLTGGLEAFEDYLDALAIAEALLIDQGYEGIYQLASFHPDYCFADATSDDPANYTNRSPWPMLHLLREAGLEKALAHHPDPEGIPARNIERMRAFGDARLAATLDALRQPEPDGRH
ncbi:DUF1415 domain-containing protein [Halomonas urumqiensis]|uniref:DUF1415 domain-containing protein n=1 Tax=Halomonas urumqiensis TaxID=1684789 RepID=A0A2N7UD65_9GAMM|nr:DUF1415 domain-containing protein [Halomonas urumqiensis]PMR78398.1 DUF1415 domain-containing protein [Halomonas urumqiensis]PTB03544.1 DUF1415 domain-containing protein [Halomonas urumqiensis]GHE20256.1 DUF1415 domain-containing protein [Halomonas urumqiensis]